MKNIRAEELSGQEPVETVELVAEVIWTGVPEEMTIPNTTLKLMSGESVVESIEVTDGSLEVKFTPVAKFNDVGEEILYSVSLDPLENFTTEIRDFVVENTYVEPVVVAEVVEEPVVEESVEEEPVVEEPVVEEPVVEEPVVEEPIVEEPVIEEPVEEPIVEEPIVQEPIVEEPKVDEASEEPKEEDALIEPINMYEPIGPDGVIPAYVTSDVPTYETLGKPEEKNTTLTSRSFAPMTVTTSSMTSPTIPGEVSIDKYATPVPGLVNTWDIKLRIEGLDSQKSSDIVLVIDRSGSMTGTKLAGAKTAAKAFVDAMAGKPSTRIAVVSFASAYGGATTVTTNQNFTTNSTDLKNAIDSLVAIGGTNTQAGIRRAATLLAGSSADLKNMVLLSDGEPTQSYEVDNVNTNFEWYNVDEVVEDRDGGVTSQRVHFRTKSNLIASDYDYGQTAGEGYAAYTYYKRVWTGSSYQYYYSSHGNNAISEAGMYKNTAGDRTLWTIALETTPYGNQVLSSIASPGKSFTASTGDLNTIFLEIAGSISSAARDAVVVDPMGPGFEIPAWEVANISATDGTAIYDSVANKIDWDIGTLSDPITSGSNIRYAELTYRVHITPDILSIPVANDQHLYPTNGDTEISYKDMNGVIQSMDFTSPVVNPIFMKVKKILMDADGNVITDPLRQFPIKIVSDATDGDVIYAEYNETYNLIPDQLITKTNLRLADDYTVSENAPDYDVTIKVDGVETNTFVVQPPVGTSDSGQADISVEITNKEKPIGKLILKKILIDENDDPILGDLREFTFNISGPGGYSTTRILKGGETEEITGLKYGEYTVVEADQVNLTAAGFTITSDPADGKVTLAWNNKEDTVEITNKYVSPKINVIAKKIWQNGNEEDHVAVTLTLYREVGVGSKTEVTGVTPTIVPASGTASEFTYTWSNLPKTDKFGNLYIYTVDELVVPDGYEKTISTDGLTITNKSKVSDLQLIKVGIDEIPLQGAEFDLYREVDSTEPGAVEFDASGGGKIYGIRIVDDTYPDGRLKTGADGKTQIVEDLEAGNYFVVERVAPTGYLLHEYPIEFVIDVTITLNEITIENELAPMIPATGGMGTWLFTILGIGIMGGALLGFKKFNNKDKGKGENTMKSRKLFTFLLTMLVLLVFVAPSIVKAAPRTTNVTIHKMELFTPKAGLPKDHDGTVLTPAQLDAALGAGNYTGLPGVVFKYWKVNSGDTVASLAGLSVAQLDAAYTTNNTLAATGVDGVITTPPLVDGFYYFREVVTPVNVTQQIASPFLLGLPVMNAAGTAFIEDLHIYPKNLTVRGAVVLKKFADDEALEGAKFRLYKGLPADNPRVEYVPEGGAAVEYETNSEGEIIINNLPVGNYFFVETVPVSPFLINTTPLTFTISANGKVTVVGGLRTAITGDVKFVELDNFEEPDVSKSIETIGNAASSGFFNEELDFFIDMVLPSDITSYTMLKVSDTIDSRLDYLGSLVVAGSTDGVNFTPLATPLQYLATQPVVGTSGLLEVVFPTPANLLNPQQVKLAHIRVSFKAAINETAIMGQGIVNTAKVDYNNGSTPGDDTSNEVKAYTGGKNFIKVNGQDLALVGAEFAVKNADGKFLKIEAGEYIWVNTLAETPFRLTSDSNGLFSIKGLKYALPGGTTYYLYETKAPMSTAGYPYNLIETDIPFLVNGSSYYALPDAITSGTDLPTAVPEEVLNILGPQIPQTGGIGTALFTLIGGGLMGFAVILNKKRSRS